MTQILDLGKLRFQFAGDYSDAISYELNDVVKYGGNVYCYINPVKTAANLPTDASYWSLMLKGVNFQGAYNAATQYRIGVVVTNGANTFTALKDVKGVEPKAGTDWAIFTQGIANRGAWATETQYFINDIVQSGGSSWICLAGHTAGAWDATKWLKFNGGVRYRGAWAANTAYLEYDIVVSGSGTYIANKNTVGAAVENAPANGLNTDFDLLCSGNGVPNAIPSSVGQVLTSTGSLAVWSSVISSTYAITGTTSTVANRRYLCSFTAPVSIALPTTPADGTLMEFSDVGGVFNRTPLTLTAAAKIQNKTESLICDLKGATVTLIYTATLGWRIL